MVYSISTSSLQASQRPPPPHYHDFLTPVLHRRFARSAGVAFGLCYLVAFLTGDHYSLLWNLFPVSWTGLRSLILFFFTATPVLLLRISHMHVDLRPSASGFHHFRRCLGSFSTYNTLGVYITSSAIFGWVYMSGATDDQGLKLVVHGRNYERPRLNERYLYLLFVSAYLGATQAIIHLAWDRGKIVLSDTPASASDIFKDNLQNRLIRALHATSFTIATVMFAYLPFRSIIWHSTLSILKNVLWLNRSTTLPPLPYGFGMFLNVIWVSLLYSLLIELSELVFTSNYVQNPFKDSKLLSDKSPDPNGTLVTGLRSNKAPLTQTMAYWELRVLSENRPDRRRALFQGVERKPNMWEQVLHECITSLNQVEIALTEAAKPPPTSKSIISPPLSQHPSTDTPPSIHINQGDVFSPNSKTRKFIESVQSSDVPAVDLTPVKKLAAQAGISNNKAAIISDGKARIASYLVSPYASFFRQSIDRKVAQLIPNVRVQVDAVKALTRLTVASLEEDEYGVVQGRVRNIVSSFASLLAALEKFITDPPCHWTESEYRRLNGTPSLPQLDLLVGTLQSSIGDINTAFSPYIGDLAARRNAG